MNTKIATNRSFGYELLQCRSLYLLLSLIAVILLIPVLEQNPRWLNAMHSVLVLVCAYTISSANPRFARVAWILVIPACLEAGYFFITGVRVSNEMFLIIYVLLFDGMAIVILLLYVLLSGKITMDQMICAVSVYMLMGVFWSSVYFLIEEISPNSFAFPPGEKYIWMDLLYFSFVTLTTLGYGDIQPVSPMARSISILESVMGVFFLTILIARLVNAYDSSQREFHNTNLINDKEV